MKFLQELRYQTLILLRNQVITISLALTLTYLLIFKLIDFGDLTPTVLTIFIFNDPAIIGLFFVGLGLINEKNTKIDEALNVTPQTLHLRLLAKITSVTALGVICASLMALFALELEVKWMWFILGNTLISLVSASIGLWLSSYTYDFLKFLLSVVPIILVLANGTMINLLQWYPMTLFKVTPFEGSVQMIAYSLGSANYDGNSLTMYTIIAIIYSVVCYIIGYRKYSGQHG